MDLKATYHQRWTQFQQQQAAKAQRIWQIGTARLLLFGLMVFCLVRLFGSSFEVLFWWWSFLGLLPFFIALLRWHQVEIEAKALLDQLVALNQRELDALEGKAAETDGGAAYVDPTHPFSSDLDLFGPRSLFAQLDRTATARGQQRLAQQLTQPLDTVADIEERQQTLQALAPLLDFRQHFIAKGALTEDSLQDAERLEDWANAPIALRDRLFWKIIRWVMPVLGVGALVYFMMSFDVRPLALVVVANLLLLRALNRYTNAEHQLLGKRQSVLRLYVTLLQHIQTQSLPTTATLQRINQTATDAQQGLERLSNIVNYFDQRLNILVGLGLNLLILYDLHCLLALEGWKAQYQQQLKPWLLEVAELDALMSWSNWVCNHPDFTFPQLEKSDQLYVEADALGHPLIPADTRVDNPVSLGQPQQVYVVTGSNMAGKSTFLRAVALNVLLAQCGAPVCAASMRCSIMQLWTSMRVQDSVQQNTSYFQAELLRLQAIIEHLKTKQPTFLILDEILKGTNSDDKLLGSQLLVRYFLTFPCLALVATHDLELGELEATHLQHIQNLCFESIIQADELLFDYRLRKGIAQNKNATFLMRQMGIVPPTSFEA